MVCSRILIKWKKIQWPISPCEIQSSSSDVSTLMTTMMGMKKKTEEHKDSKIYPRPYVEDVLESLSSSKEE